MDFTDPYYQWQLARLQQYVDLQAAGPRLMAFGVPPNPGCVFAPGHPRTPGPCAFGPQAWAPGEYAALERAARLEQERAFAPCWARDFFFAGDMAK